MDGSEDDWKPSRSPPEGRASRLPVSSARSRPLPAAVPRKFGVGTLLVVSSAYAALFGLLRFLNWPALAVMSIALFLTAIGLGQLIFGQRAARVGSVVAGMIAWPIMIVVPMLIAEGSFDVRRLPDLLVNCLCLSIPGAICGYVGGVLVAGVFLAMDTADRMIHRRADGSTESPAAASVGEHPLAPRPAAGDAAGKDDPPA